MQYLEDSKFILNNWDEFKSVISKQAEDNLKFFFRGQCNSSWKLKTSFHRYATSVSMTLKDYIQTVIPYVNRYVSSVNNEIIHLEDPLEYGSLLSFLQHHGFPTPLLDWTLSPYIAAYFAYREIDDDNPRTDSVKIFMFNYGEWTNTFSQPADLKSEKEFVSVINPFSKFNTRSINQQSACTVTNVEDVESYIKSLEVINKKNFLFSIELPVKDKPKIMRDLRLMGITEMSLFPGADGLCRELKNEFFSKNEIGSTPKEMIADLYKAIGQNLPPP